MKRYLLLLIIGLSAPVLADLGSANLNESDTEDLAKTTQSNLLTSATYNGWCGKVTKEVKNDCSFKFENGRLIVNESDGILIDQITDIQHKLIGKWGFMASQYWWYEYTFYYEIPRTVKIEREITPKVLDDEKNENWWDKYSFTFPWFNQKEEKVEQKEEIKIIKDKKVARITMQAGMKGGKAVKDFKNNLQTWIGQSLETTCIGAVPAMWCTNTSQSYDPGEAARALSGALQPLNNSLQQKNTPVIINSSPPNNYGTNSAAQDYQNHLQQNQQFNQQQRQTYTDSMQDFRIRQLETGY
tara:strand:+ start:87 stop:983 length:897 start_codon:yes stop_codon:yes gene_type:complete